MSITPLVRTGAMIMFTLAAEFHLMSALLDSHVVIKDIVAENAALRRVGFIAEGQRGAVHGDVRSIETRTVGAWLRCRQRVAVRPEGVGVGGQHDLFENRKPAQ